MPERYLAIRDRLIEQGKPAHEAKRIAAATYNAQRKPNEPKVSPAHESLGDALAPRKPK